ncbi:hypothetical protein ILUMI_03252 [Ignelater luminosus]|uniref:Uncharacterized protein n=1 Tax=Ignelater luminosus TaxID=2038154 RepID=A0A8K0GKM2_IGNLU|nr:hypothetical protein ILUMI_03252 [Ignelater luminosus]
MSDTEQCIECVANCSLFICEILCFCCFTDSNWCFACCNGCGCNETTQTTQTSSRSNTSSSYPPNRCVTNQPERAYIPYSTPQHAYYPSSIVPQPTAPCEEASLLSPTKDDKMNDLPPSYEEATKGQLLESTLEHGNDTK